MTMYSLAMSIKKTALVLSIILYAVDQASSLKCYNCTDVSVSSNPDSDCFKNPAKNEFEITCPGNRNVGFTLPFPDSTLSVALPDYSASRGGDASYASSDMGCLTLHISFQGAKGITRMCIPKSISDQELKEVVEQQKVSVDSIYRCDTDLCNSSGTPPPSSSSTPSPGPSSTNAPNSSKALGSAFLSLISSLFSVYFIIL